MSARDRKAVDYAKGRLTAALEVLAWAETHDPHNRLNTPLREALGIGAVKLKCSCRDCVQVSHKA